MAGKRDTFSATEIKAGVFVVLSAVSVVVLVAALLRYEPAIEGDSYYARFRETSGLRVGDEVRFGGMLVGRVIQLEHDSDDHSRIRVSFRVNTGTPINAASQAYITQLSIASNHHLEVTTGSLEAPVLAAGEELPTTRGGLLGQLEGVAEAVNGLVVDLRQTIGVSDEQGRPLLAAEDRSSLMDLMGRMDGLMGDFRVLVGVEGPDGQLLVDPEQQTTFASFLNQLQSLADNGDTLVTEIKDTVNENRESLTEIIEAGTEIGKRTNDLLAKLEDTLDVNRPILDATVAEAQQAMTDIRVLVERLDTLTVSLQGTLDESRPDIDALLRETRRMVQTAGELADTLNQQPQSLVRGRQPVGREQ